MVGLILFISALSAAPGEWPVETREIQALAENEPKFQAALLACYERERQTINEAQDKMDAARVAGNQSIVDDQVALIKKHTDILKQSFERAMEKYPENPRILVPYGEILYDYAGDAEGGLRSWELALTKDSTCGAAHNNLAMHYCHNGEYEKGFQHLDESLALEPKNPNYLFNAVQVYLVNFPQLATYKKWNREQIYLKAMEYSRLAAKLQPKDYELTCDYAVNFLAAEDFGVPVKWADAAKAWQKARKNAQREDQCFFSWLNEGRAWVRGKNLAKAEKCVNEALKIIPNSDPAKALLADIKSERGSKTKPREKAQP